MRKRRGLSRTVGAINIADHIDQADNDEELFEIILAWKNLIEESENNYEKESQSALHHAIEVEESSFFPSEWDKPGWRTSHITSCEQQGGNGWNLN